jgi:hypothetical protein
MEQGPLYSEIRYVIVFYSSVVFFNLNPTPRSKKHVTASA